MPAGKERINDILRKRSGNTVCWFTLIDSKTTSGMPEDIKKLPPFEFYRHVGCDIMQFGGYGLKGTFSPCRLRRVGVDEETLENQDGSVTILIRSTWGNLTGIYRDTHPIKHPVATVDELRIFKQIWLNSCFEEDRTDAFEKTLSRVVADIGEDGIMVNTVDPSPVQQLLEMDCGLINFYNLYQDYPDEIEELLDIMHDCRKKEYEILARRTPLDCVIPVENTSTALISPRLYEKLSLPQITDFVTIMHKNNKLAVLHMCGHLKSLLALVKETGCDGINATTPPPLGDTKFEDVFDVFGDDFIILGGIFNPFQEHGISKEKLWHELEKLYTPKNRNANLLLGMGADGQSMPYERFIWVGEWFRQQQ